MRVRFCSLVLIAVLALTGFTASSFAGEANQISSPGFSVVSAGYLLLPKTNTEWCTVSLDNPRSNLNVRNTNGKVVTRLRHGTSVYVDDTDGGFARISVKRRGRMVILGWVASEYLVC
jgi:hypothetical protein